MAGLNTELHMQQSAETVSAVEHFARLAAAARPERLKPHPRQPYICNILGSFGGAIVSLPVLMALSICLALALLT